MIFTDEDASRNDNFVSFRRRILSNKKGQNSTRQPMTHTQEHKPFSQDFSETYQRASGFKPKLWKK